MNSDNRPIWEDVEIHLKWGTLRGLRRRPMDSSKPTVRMLGLHGWLDNCKAFEPLAFYLHKNIDLLVLDLPGHGLSDHIPQGARYDSFTYTMSVKDAMHEYGWDTFILVGHSLGASIGHFFTAIFPQMVDAFVTIDFLGYMGTPTRVVSFETFKTEVENFHRLENQVRTPPSYSREEVLNKLVDSRVFKTNPEHSMTLPFAKILFERAVRPVGNGRYTWTHDQRAKVTFMFSPGYRFMYAMALSYTCPVLIIMARDGIYISKTVNEKRIVAAYSKNCSHFKYVKLPGRHHIHMTNAEAVAFHINEFVEISLGDNKIVSKL